MKSDLRKTYEKSKPWLRFEPERSTTIESGDRQGKVDLNICELSPAHLTVLLCRMKSSEDLEGGL